jgi:hypothetical protein
MPSRLLVVHRILEDQFNTGRDRTDYQTALRSERWGEGEEDFKDSSDKVKLEVKRGATCRHEARLRWTLTTWRLHCPLRTFYQRFPPRTFLLRELAAWDFSTSISCLGTLQHVTLRKRDERWYEKVGKAGEGAWNNLRYG